MVVNKITWAKVGGVTEPGRYMFRFGWLTITAEDLAIWQQLPNAEFTLVPTIPTTGEVGSEFRLGTFGAPETDAQLARRDTNSRGRGTLEWIFCCRYR